MVSGAMSTNYRLVLVKETHLGVTSVDPRPSVSIVSNGLPTAGTPPMLFTLEPSTEGTEPSVLPPPSSV